MKHKSSHKAVTNTQSRVNYTRTKDAYDGNMELTNLKAFNQKISGSVNGNVETLHESTKSRMDEQDDE